MNFDAILSAIDAQIAQLQQARVLLVNGTATAVKTGAGRSSKRPAKAATPAKRMMSEEARARIAAAQKKRWAKARRAAK